MSRYLDVKEVREEPSLNPIFDFCTMIFFYKFPKSFLVSYNLFPKIDFHRLILPAENGTFRVYTRHNSELSRAFVASETVKTSTPDSFKSKKKPSSFSESSAATQHSYTFSLKCLTLSTDFIPFTSLNNRLDIPQNIQHLQIHDPIPLDSSDNKLHHQDRQQSCCSSYRLSLPP